MILKLTRTYGGQAFLVDTTGLLILPYQQEGVKLLKVIVGLNEVNVKETIEEIEQQIKEGGITNGIN
jgi:hypothetical protein